MSGCEARCAHCFGRCMHPEGDHEHGVAPDGHWKPVPDLTDDERAAIADLADGRVGARFLGTRTDK